MALLCSLYNPGQFIQFLFMYNKKGAMKLVLFCSTQLASFS